MAEQFLIWSKQYVEGQCVVRGPEGIKKSFQLSRGMARADQWPEAAPCRMSDEYPKDIELTDNIYGTGLTIISKRTKEVLAAAKVNPVEYLPVQIYNHKNRLASADYFVLNPPSTVECIDIKASGVDWNDVNADLIDSCKKLVIKSDAVPESIQLLRPKHAPFLILLRASLARQLEKAKLTGLHFRDPLEYRGA